MPRSFLVKKSPKKEQHGSGREEKRRKRNRLKQKSVPIADVTCADVTSASDASVASPSSTHVPVISAHVTPTPVASPSDSRLPFPTSPSCYVSEGDTVIAYWPQDTVLTPDCYGNDNSVGRLDIHQVAAVVDVYTCPEKTDDVILERAPYNFHHGHNEVAYHSDVVAHHDEKTLHGKEGYHGDAVNRDEGNYHGKLRRYREQVYHGNVKHRKEDVQQVEVAKLRASDEQTHQDQLHYQGNTGEVVYHGDDNYSSIPKDNCVEPSQEDSLVSSLLHPKSHQHHPSHPLSFTSIQHGRHEHYRDSQVVSHSTSSELFPLQPPQVLSCDTSPWSHIARDSTLLSRSPSTDSGVSSQSPRSDSVVSPRSDSVVSPRSDSVMSPRSDSGVSSHSPHSDSDVTSQSPCSDSGISSSQPPHSDTDLSPHACGLVTHHHDSNSDMTPSDSIIHECNSSETFINDTQQSVDVTNYTKHEVVSSDECDVAQPAGVTGSLESDDMEVEMPLDSNVTGQPDLKCDNNGVLVEDATLTTIDGNGSHSSMGDRGVDLQEPTVFTSISTSSSPEPQSLDANICQDQFQELVTSAFLHRSTDSLQSSRSCNSSPGVQDQTSGSPATVRSHLTSDDSCDYSMDSHARQYSRDALSSDSMDRAGSPVSSENSRCSSPEAFGMTDGRSRRRNPLRQISDQSRQRYTCSECGKAYATSSNLSRHKQTHRSLDSQLAKKCPHCHKVYVSMPALSMHILTHSLKHKCPVCDKAFSRPWLLQGHMRSHTGEKPYGCAHCGKAFADRSNLRAHMQTHSSFKHYTCKRCDKSFALKSYLNKHYESACFKD